MAWFISEDSIGFAGGQSNFYAYAGNSPLMYRDPNGRLLLEANIGAGVGALWGGISGLIHHESGDEILRDIAEDAAIGGLAGMTYVEGSLAREALRYAARAAINAGGEALKECMNDGKLNGVNIAAAGIGSVIGDFAGDSATAMNEAAGFADRVGTSVIGSNVGAGVRPDQSAQVVLAVEEPEDPGLAAVLMEVAMYTGAPTSGFAVRFFARRAAPAEIDGLNLQPFIDA